MNFWEQYSWWVLVALAVFPRLTLFLLFPWGGWLWWVGWFVTPHLLVAILALGYWQTNPVLVVISWLVALAGTFGEGAAAQRRF